MGHLRRVARNRFGRTIAPGNRPTTNAIRAQVAGGEPEGVGRARADLFGSIECEDWRNRGGLAAAERAISQVGRGQRLLARGVQRGAEAMRALIALPERVVSRQLGVAI